MKREEELHRTWQAMMAERKINISFDEFLTIIDVADEHPKNPWHKIEELPEIDPAMASRGFNLSLPVLLCDIDYLTCYNGARFHYDPARYDFDKKQWQDIIGCYNEETGITHTHWMYQPEPPKGGEK